MLKKRFYDILTIIYILLAITILLVGNQIFVNTFVEKASAGDYSFFSSIYISQAIVSILAFIYWLFILLLAINLHKEGLTKTLDLVVIAIIIPLAPIFYLTNLRKPLKKYFEK